MEARIEELALCIFKSPSNEERKAAEAEIAQLAETVEFYQTAFQIIVSHSNKSVRQEVMVWITKYFKSVPPELKQFCFESFIKSLPNIDRTHLNYAEKMANEWTEEYIKVFGWPAVREKIISPENQLSSLMLAKAVCKELKRKRNQTLELFTDFAVEIFPIFVQILESQDFYLIQMAFHIANRLIKTSETAGPSKQLKEFIEPISEQFLPNLQPFYNYSSILLNIQKTIEYEKLTVEILKFLSNYVYIIKHFLDENTLSPILSYMQSIFTSNLSSKSIGKALELLYSITFRAKVVSVLSENAEYFVSNVFAPFFVLQPAEIEFMETDPALFVQTIEKEGNDWCDPRASVSHIIKKSNQIGLTAVFENLFNYLTTTLQNAENSSQIFSACDMFSSSVYKFDPQQFSELIPTLCELCDNEDFVIRAAAFKILSNAVNCKSTINAIEVCLNHLNDEAILVSYYASVSLSLTFRTIKNSEMKDELLESLRKNSVEIVDIFLRINTEFNNENIAYSLMDILEFFSDDVLPYAVSISENLLKLYEETSKSNEQQGESLIPHSINTLIECMKKMPDNTDSLKEIFSHLLQTTENLIGVCDLEEIFRIGSRIVYNSTHFDPLYWEILPYIQRNLEIEDFLCSRIRPLLSFLIDRDTNINERGVVPIILELLHSCYQRDESDGSDILNIVAGLTVKTGQLEIMQNFADVIAAVYNEDKMIYDGGVDSCVSVILCMSDFQGMSNLFGDITNEMLSEWSECEEFPFKIQTIISKFNDFVNFDFNFAINCLASSIKAIHGQINYKEDDEDDDKLVFYGDMEEEDEKTQKENNEEEDEEKDKMFALDTIGGSFGSSDMSADWFNQSELIKNFHNLMISVKSNEEIMNSLSQLLEQSGDGTDYLSCVDQMLNYAKKIQK
ncbi:hypothetical protein TVAG_287480 [Trichomonas vaginalis G3]|uniref:Importin N-terminal domain-containing protein n=1 Tax=Trichomonas vaginalis (strain ATCC PRA-98 / G3) TaxID=412133 RepID=A2FKE7_TRIV3|nr:armadillo (ARM) repeat-containing protein family [Trichomonas vaginalis G3]EAX94613.1 hypothetical protein TVAG_287480 [Trichomonas vaginalis G3]KAI5553723.1 armadillo (ARM) repeat-containing protein family [Trichomonas vaginalis G3]|eukprot:XP_001307543.1 hypothetical protein [Trichomonas vaginalis G3]